MTPEEKAKVVKAAIGSITGQRKPTAEQADWYRVGGIAAVDAMKDTFLALPSQMKMGRMQIIEIIDMCREALTEITPTAMVEMIDGP